MERRATRDCVASTVPSLRNSTLFHFYFPALTFRAFPCRRFAAGAIAPPTFLRASGLRHRLAPPVQHDSVPSIQIQQYSAGVLASPARTGLSNMYLILALKSSSRRRARSNDSSCQTRPTCPVSLLIRCAETLLSSCMISGMLKVPCSSYLGV